MDQYVIYKFKSQMDIEYLPIDGMNISVGNLKKEIIKRNNLGQRQDVDLKILEYCENKPYNDDNALIDAYKQLIVIRVPSTRPRNKTLQAKKSNEEKFRQVDDPCLKIYDLVNADMTEQDKIRIMMSQSTYYYKASDYMDVRDAERQGPVPECYRCHRCHRPGHWIYDCPLQSKFGRFRKCSEIPRNCTVPVEGPEVRGALLTATGPYAVPTIDYQVYNKAKSEAAPSSSSSVPFKVESSVAPKVDPLLASPVDHKVALSLAPSDVPKLEPSVISTGIAPSITSRIDESAPVVSHRLKHPCGNIWKKQRHQPYSTSRPTVLRNQMRQLVTLV